MAKQPTELLNPEQLVDLVAEFIKECRERPKAQALIADSVHLAAMASETEQPSVAH